MFRLFECCALSFFERFVLSFSLKIERFVSDSAEIWICGLYKRLLRALEENVGKYERAFGPIRMPDEQPIPPLPNIKGEA